MKHYKTVLTIAGSDSCGGAGIQADLKTFSALCCYGMSAITVLTAQNTQGVQAFNKVSAKFVRKQIESVFDDIKVDAIKTGLLLTADIINTVAAAVGNYQKKALIVDPVMVAKNKKVLLNKSAQKAMLDKLFPLATLVTPNIDEAEHLLDMLISNLDSMQEAAVKISNLGARAVLIKGGHLSKMKKSVDCLYIKKENEFYWFALPRVNTKNTHGAGCTLSAAITAYMAHGCDLVTAVTRAKKYVAGAILAGKQYRLGEGPGPTCHFYRKVSSPDNRQ
ncbi:MAG TPA: bifunctional hydroxymethylpyrimidine kinase/phosphomethylpyrimidine kinase [Coxiellaceae bacterium]|nr:bifunctional hydroxymethylpyrimidine kinase/phosphomethylpyrimidine kinase [Coxiellaceae bacterium]